MCVCVYSPHHRTCCRSVWGDTGTAGSLFHCRSSRCLGHSGHSDYPLHQVDMGTAHLLGHTHTHHLHTCDCQCPKPGTYTLITRTQNKDKLLQMLCNIGISNISNILCSMFIYIYSTVAERGTTLQMQHNAKLN